MGCDIHSLLEIKRPASWEREGDPAGWFAVDAALFRAPYFNDDQPVSLNNAPYTSEPLRSRNYRLFAMLADVRNGRGFAGTDTGDRVEPIAEPRGVPADASPEWVKEVGEWDVDMHSQSWFTLAELEAYDWDALVFERGYVSEEVYLQLRGTNASPQSWSGGIGGGGIRTFTALEYEALTRQELDALHAELPVRGHPLMRTGIYVQYQWAETRRENMGELAAVMEVMRNSAPYVEGTSTDRDHTQIRVVFGFDN